MAPILVIPGLGGSDEAHWQTHIERALPGAARVHQDDWDKPRCVAWVTQLADALDRAPGAVLVAHSLGCAAIAHLAAQRPDLCVGAALLVAPADVDATHNSSRYLHDFAPLPLRRLPFRSILVASTNDPYMSLERARTCAQAWGSSLMNLGACGHINVAAGFGLWPMGQAIVEQLAAS